MVWIRWNIRWEDRTEQDRTEHDRTEQNRIEQNRIEQGRTGQKNLILPQLKNNSKMKKLYFKN